MHKGFIAPEKIETREEGAEHVLGAIGLSAPIINPSGDWTPYIGPGEAQISDHEETYACTVFNTLKAIEDLIFFYTGERVNYADRYVANVAVMKGILNPNSGANAHLILELIRTTTGLILDGRLPFDDNYYTVEQSLMAELMLEGPAWYKEWKLNHLWLWSGTPTPEQKRAIIQDALTKGIPCVSVYAWMQGPIDDLYIKPPSFQDGHWTGLRKLEKSQNTYSNYVCKDSYPPFIKKLDPLFDFQYGKLIYLTKPVHTFLKTLYFGATDSEVEYLQKALVSLGYPIPHAISNYYGTETRTALWKFQLTRGIKDDGSHFGPLTRAALNMALEPRTGLGGLLQFIGSILGIKLWQS